MADGFGIALVISSWKEIILVLKRYVFLQLLLIFVLYTFVVNMLWALELFSMSPIKSSINYLYSFLLATAIYVMFRTINGRTFVFWAIFFAQIIQILVMPFATREWGFRTVLYFNNPNQLALWSVNLLVITEVLLSSLRVAGHYRLAMRLLPVFFVILSVSKAGLVAFAFFAIVSLIRLNRRQLLFTAAILVGLTPFISQGLSHIKVIDNVSKRMETDNSDDDNLTGRGFDRITTEWQYLFFGAGEGSTDRFKSKYHGELHSTPFTVLFCYGLLGSSLFGLALYLVLSGGNIGSKLVLFMVLGLFTMGHMTLRIPMFWLALFSINSYKDCA